MAGPGAQAGPGAEAGPATLQVPAEAAVQAVAGAMMAGGVAGKLGEIPDRLVRDTDAKSLATVLLQRGRTRARRMLRLT